MNNKDLSHLIQNIVLEKELPFSKEIFSNLKKLNLDNSVIFGGSLRDFFINNYNTNTINDYDLRIVSNLPESEIIPKLNSVFGPHKIVPSVGTNKPRYIFYFNGIEMDVSIRTEADSNKNLSLNTLERVFNADAAISSFVLNSDMKCFCRKEAISDINNNTLSFYLSNPFEKTISNQDRLAYYINKMSKKFPHKKIILIP